MEAIAAYVRQLRDTQGISRERLGEMVGTGGNNIWRIEEQGQEPRGGLLLLIVQALHGSLDDAALLLREGVDVEEGRQRAIARLAEFRDIRHKVGPEKARRLADRLDNDERVREAIHILSEVLDD